MFQTFVALLADDLLLSLSQLEYFPADFFVVLVVALQIRSNVGDDFGGLIFLYEANDS